LLNIPAGEHTADTINTRATGTSLFAHGDIIPRKLRWFARIDVYNPNRNFNNILYKSYAGISAPPGYNSDGYRMTYSNTGAPVSATPIDDITAKEVFSTIGLDFTPLRNVHLEPNIWYNSYASQLPAGKRKDHDLVYRMTFFFAFGRNYKNSYNQF
ncbi:MAG: hypothetical protein J7539_18525, partial [Niabella sp.]|nr:hypothetical protein [Niabella sp.]